MTIENADVRCDAAGSVVYVTPMTESGREWVADNLSLESWQWQGESFAVEHRYAQELVLGMRGDGLSVSTAFCY
jgi:hypothetical protein